MAHYVVFKKQWSEIEKHSEHKYLHDALLVNLKDAQGWIIHVANVFHGARQELRLRLYGKLEPIAVRKTVYIGDGVTTCGWEYDGKYKPDHGYRYDDPPGFPGGISGVLVRLKQVGDEWVPDNGDPLR